MHGNSTRTDAAIFGAEYTRNPYPIYAQLRKEGPVHQTLTPNDLPVWLVTRYEDVRSALADPRLSKDSVRAREVISNKLNGRPSPFSELLSAHMLNSDPPDHTRLRRLVTKAFTARRVERLRPRVEEITEELLDRFAVGTPVDLIDAFAFPLPITVISELLGVPQEDQEKFRAWSNVLVGNAGPDEIKVASEGMAGYIGQLIAVKRTAPSDDLLSDLIQASDGDDDRLNEVELISMMFLLLVAGHETTVNLVGNGMLALLNNPEQLDKLRANPDLIGSAVEEFLRFDSPVTLATFRFTVEPVQFGDVTVPEGELVLVSVASANRDAGRFDRPDELDINRPLGGHMAFGHGIHYCLGAPLARLEAEVAITKLLARFSDVKLGVEAQQIDWRSSVIMRGMTALPVVVG